MPSTYFKNGLKGWTTTNGTEIFDDVNGDPAGSLRGVESGSDVWYFSASDKYLGDMSAYYGGALSFDLKQDGDASQFNDDDIILTGNGLTIVWDAPANPGTDWTHYASTCRWARAGAWIRSPVASPPMTRFAVCWQASTAC